jgi:hypothetical protein
MGLRWWSWQLMLPAVSLVALLVAVHFLVAPLVPTNFFMGSSGALVFQLNGTDGDQSLTCKHHGAIVYRNAPWKPEVGCWLSQCGNFVVPIPLVEVRMAIPLLAILAFHT